METTQHKAIVKRELAISMSEKPILSAIIVDMFNSREIKNASGVTQYFQIKMEDRILKRLAKRQAFYLKTRWLSNKQTHTL